MRTLTDELIRQLVFNTFGLARFSQDSPIRPDVWVTFLKLARRRIKRQVPTDRSENAFIEGTAEIRAKGLAEAAIRVPLLLTPKESMGADGQAAGSAAQLAEGLRNSILGSKRDARVPAGSVPVSRKLMRETEGSLDAASASEAKALGRHRIAATSRYVVIEATFEEVINVLLPRTHWWASVGARPEVLWDQVADQVARNARLSEALSGLPDTEYLRFAALAGLTHALLNLDLTAQQFDALIALVAPLHVEPEVALAPNENDDELFFLKGASVDPVLSGPVVEGLRLLWESYRQLVDGRNRGAQVERHTALIWTVQINRQARRSAVKPAPLSRLSVRSGDDSCATVKADAAKRLFDLKMSNIAWAVIDTGIDAHHKAFLVDPKTRAKGTRIVATLDFTVLQDLLSENRDVLAALKARVKAAEAVDDAVLDERFRRTLIDLRDANVAGRGMDWTLLEPLIRMDPFDAPTPADGHGTHVAGLIGGYLPEGVETDRVPFEGMCPDIKLYDLRVFSADPKDRRGGDEFTVLAALDYVAWVNRDPMRPAIHGVNLSLSVPFQVDWHACGRTPVCEACDRLVWNSTVVVAAAGNAGYERNKDIPYNGVGFRGVSITDPGNAQEVITVGATHRGAPHTYGVSYFSSRGPTGDGRLKPDIVAPGEKIRSTVPNNATLLRDGTSMAAPHVSGVCAMLMARYPELIGEPERIKRILMDTATDLNRERHFQGAGIVDALRALQSV
jgi:subtilisin family serine protease